MAGITLAQAEAKLPLYLSIDDALGVNAEVTIDGTTLKRMAVADLLKLRSMYFNYYQQELAGNKIAQGLGSGSGKIRVRL